MYKIQHQETRPVPRLITFASGNNLEALKELDFEDTQIVDTSTGKIISNFGERSEEYGKGYRKRIKNK